MTKFIMTELVDTSNIETARLGPGPGLGAGGSQANLMTDAEVGKFVKLVGESRFDLCVVGDQIEGRITSVETSTQDGYSIGGVMDEGRFAVTFNGLQGTPGTGVAAIGSYVVTGTPIAKGTALSVAGQPAAVCVATAAANTLLFRWRVCSLGAAGTGAVGTTGCIELIG